MEGEEAARCLAAFFGHSWAVVCACGGGGGGGVCVWGREEGEGGRGEKGEEGGGRGGEGASPTGHVCAASLPHSPLP